MAPSTTPAVDAPASSPGETQSFAGQLIERTSAAMALADLNGLITFVNPAFLALWGFRDAGEALSRHTADDFWMETERARSIRAALAEHGVWQGELAARTTAGKPRHVRVTAQLLLDGHGKPQAMLATFVDISAEHAARNALDAQRQFTALVLDGAGVLIVALDNSGRFIRFNSECERLSGWHAQEVLGRFPWETVVPHESAQADRTEAFQASMDAAEVGRTTKYTNEWVCRSGSRQMIEWTNRVLIDPEGQGRVMVAVGIDVSARRKAEQALARSEAQLRAAQAVARMGSWELDIATGTLEWSDEVFDLFEIDKANFSATYAAFLAAIHPDDRVKVDRTYASSLDSRQPYRIAHRLRMDDGRIKWVEENGETD